MFITKRYHYVKATNKSFERETEREKENEVTSVSKMWQNRNMWDQEQQIKITFTKKLRPQ
jgi:hypothetical protein